MPIPPDVERLLAANKRREEQRERRQRKVDKFMDWARETFGERLPLFIPSVVDTKKQIRRPLMHWRKEGREMMKERFWQKCMQHAITEDEADGCIQVKLGVHSFNLCVLDVDADELVEPLLEVMPFLKDTLQTRGSKGRHFWIFMEGEYPLHKKQIIRDGLTIEFLTEGNLCTIWGTHYKSAEPYEIWHSATPITIKFGDIKPPAGGEWKAKASSNGADGKAIFTRNHTRGTAGKHGGIDWDAYHAMLNTDNTLVELLVCEYFDATWHQEDSTWRCGDLTGRPPSNKGSFMIRRDGSCWEWDDESSISLVKAITSDERVPKNTQEDVFTYLAEQGDEYNFFMPAASEELPQVLLPILGRNESAFAEDVAKHIPENTLFNKDGFIVELENDDGLGTDDNVAIAPFGMVTSKFSGMNALRLATWVEQYMDTGVMVQVDKDTVEINRILDVAIPIRTIQGDIVYPQTGYNKHLRLYCVSDMPMLERLEHQRALDIIQKDVYGEFCFKDAQSRTHAVARLITPYMRGIMGFHTRMPLWWFDGNRPGTGKDYCNGCSQLVYLGRAFEDAPVGENSEETRKRITAAMVAGRRMMYFANCQHHLSDPTLLTAITDSVFRTRMLGTTNAASDLELVNEIEFSLSANMGITCKEDYERRTRKITLEFYEQHTNARKFNRPNLWGWILENRWLILSAIHTLFLHWVEKGQPKGVTPFTSFPGWAETVGGIMVANELGDPCQPQADDLFGGDLRTRAMVALYEIAYQINPDGWWSKEALYQTITTGQRGTMGINGDDRLEWFGDLNNDIKKQENRVKTGMAIKAFKGRILNNIKMELDESQRAARQRVRFSRV